MTHTCVGLTSPHSRPNLRLSVSVSRKIAEDASATHSSVPSRGPGLPHPHAGAQRNGGRSRCARGAAQRKRSLSRILPLPASRRHCRLMRHVSGKRGSGTRQKRCKEAAAVAAPGQQPEPRGRPLRASPSPPLPLPARGLCQRTEAALPPRGRWKGGGRSPLHVPFRPCLS